VLPNSPSGATVEAMDAAYDFFPSFEAFSARVVTSEHLHYYVELLDRDRSSEVHGGAVLGATEAVIRAAAFDTGAVEDLYKTDRGRTMSVAREEGRWEDLMDRQPGDVRALFEAQLAVYRRLQGWDGQEPVTEAFIRSLHADLCKPQKTYTVWLADGGSSERPLNHGSYKDLPNHVALADGTVHAYAPVSATASEVRRLVQELQSDLFNEADAVTQAAFAHYALVRIHPFADGNGRVARALASAYLYRGYGLPLVLLADQRDRYLDSLELADQGSFETFNLNMMDCLVASIMMLHDELRRPAELPDPVATVKSIADLLETNDAHDRLDENLSGLLQTLHEIVAAELNRAGLAAPLKTKVSSATDKQFRPPAGSTYRLPIRNTAHVSTVTVTAPAPANVGASIRFAAFPSSERRPAAPYLISCSDEGVDDFLVTAAEAQNFAQSPDLRWRLTNWIGVAVARFIADLESQVRQALANRNLEL